MDHVHRLREGARSDGRQKLKVEFAGILHELSGGRLGFTIRSGGERGTSAARALGL
jgi:hypothetical protein